MEQAGDPSGLQVSLDTTGEGVDWVRTLLGGTDYMQTVHIATYPEAGQPGAAGPWSYTLSFSLPQDQQARARVGELERLLEPLQRTGLASELRVAIGAAQQPQDAGFSAAGHRIGQRFVLLPPGAAPPATGDLPILLGATLAFGSGLHPATILALQLLERYAQPGMQALDLGCGSGILTIALARLGATVLAVDNDGIAVQATQEAVRQNGVTQQVTVRESSLGEGSQLGHWMNERTLPEVPSVAADGAFDLIVANILARVHVTLAPTYYQALRRQQPEGGLLISSGFTSDQQETVAEALEEAGFAAVDLARQADWVALVHQRR